MCIGSAAPTPVAPIQSTPAPAAAPPPGTLRPAPGATATSQGDGGGGPTPAQAAVAGPASNVIGGIPRTPILASLLTARNSPENQQRVSDRTDQINADNRQRRSNFLGGTFFT